MQLGHVNNMTKPIYVVRTLASNDAAGFVAANIAYFERIHSITGNATLQNILRTIEKQAMRYRYFAHRFSKDMQESSTANLRRILDRMRKRDVEGVRFDTEGMMMQAHKLIVDVLKRPAENLNRGDSRGANFVIHSVWEDGSCQHHCQKRCGRDFRD